MAVQFSPVCLKRLLFFPSVQLPWYLNLKWVGHTCVALFLTLYFFSFIYISIFIPTQYCCAYYGLMLSLAINVNSSIFSKLLWLLGSMYFHVSLQLLVNFYKKILLGFWLALCWMYRSSDTKWQPSNTKFSDPWTPHLSLRSFRFQFSCTDTTVLCKTYLHFVFLCHWNGIFILNSSYSLQCTEMQLIFVSQIWDLVTLLTR